MQRLEDYDWTEHHTGATGNQDYDTQGTDPLFNIATHPDIEQPTWWVDDYEKHRYAECNSLAEAESLVLLLILRHNRENK